MKKYFSAILFLLAAISFNAFADCDASHSQDTEGHHYSDNLSSSSDSQAEDNLNDDSSSDSYNTSADNYSDGSSSSRDEMGEDNNN